MLLRWIVGNYLRQSAESAMQQALRQAARLVQRGSDEPPVVPDHFRLAVAGGLNLELSGLVSLMQEPASGRFDHVHERWGPLGDVPVRVVETGVGAERAAESMRQAIARNRPSWVVAAGFATALDAEFRRGDIFMPTEVVAANESSQTAEPLQIGFQVPAETLAATPYLRVGKLASLDRVLATPAEKDSLAAATGAAACDMETRAIAEVCHDAHIRFLAVRVITDVYEDQLPPELVHLLQQKTVSGKLGAATGAVFRRPASVKDLWHLREDAQKASQRLASFLRGVLEQLAPQL